MRESNLVKHIGVVCYYPFPDGLAATNRIIAYGKGLVNNGVSVDVFILKPTDSYTDKSEKCSKGEIEGIKYHYPRQKKSSKYKVVRVYGKWIFHLYSLINIIHIHKLRKLDFLFISNDRVIILFFYSLIAKILFMKPIFIADEFPLEIRELKRTNISKVRRIILQCSHVFVDSFIFMTRQLNEFYNLKKNKPYFIMSSITDFSRFDIRHRHLKGANHKSYLCYLGNLELNKDNVDNIIIAFSMISNSFPKMELHLYGLPTKKDKDKLVDLISVLKIKSLVFLKGLVDYEHVPYVLSNAVVLLSSQPNTKRAMGGFPTKLGEYMATGVPVLLTNVGEIADYVNNCEHVYLVEPEKPAAYAKQLKYILEHYEDALAVAANGKRLVLKKYDVNTIGKSLKAFLNIRLN